MYNLSLLLVYIRGFVLKDVSRLYLQLVAEQVEVLEELERMTLAVAAEVLDV